jgi:chromosomal replication initiation ATPase DnaA
MEINTRYTVPFTPLAERIAQEAPHLSPGLEALRTELGNDDFEKYINSLVSLRQVQDQLLIITKREMYRSIIVSRFLPAIKQCFSVRFVQVINQ